MLLRYNGKAIGKEAEKMELHTERLLLRHPIQQDYPALCKIQNTYHVLKYNAMKKQSVEQLATFMEKNKEENLCIFLKESGELIGLVAMEPDSLRYGIQAISLSYYLSESKGRKGYMKEALQAVIDAVFASGKELISARVFAKNTASLQLVKSLGFQKEGCIRRCVKGYDDIIYDDVIHSMLKEEWEAIKKEY